MEKPSFIFTAPFTVNVEMKDGQEKVTLDGLASTSDQDLVDDIVTKNCMESMQRQIMEKSIKLDIEHESFRGDTVEEKEINKTRIPAGRLFDSAVEPLGNNRWGLRIKSMLNSFHQRFREIKGSVVDGFLDAYSIAYIPTKVAMIQKKGKTIRMLDDVRLLNIALTGNPINTSALNQQIFMKAIDAMEEYKSEKLKNPAIENKLEVKAGHSAKWHELVEKLRKEGKVESPEAVATETLGEESYKSIHASGGSNESHNQKEVKMEETEKEKEERLKKEKEEEAEKKEEEEETEKEKEEAKSKEFKSQLSAIEKDMTEVKSSVAELKALKTEIAEIKAILEKSNMKSPAHQASEAKSASESKSLGPLDLIK